MKNVKVLQLARIEVLEAVEYFDQFSDELGNALVDEFHTAIPWLTISNDQRKAIRGSDDALDALICALLAKAACAGKTVPPPPKDAEAARTEGWIHMPRNRSLRDFFVESQDL